MLNSIGLANLGVREYCKSKLPYLNELDTNFIINIAGYAIKDYVETKEMYRTFNMGMGMIIIVNENDAEKSVSILGDGAQIIGSVRNGQGIEHRILKTD